MESALFTSLSSLEPLCMCQKMANEQSNTQTSQLDEEDLKKLKEAISENNACSSSMQSGEVNVCWSSTSETRSSSSGNLAHAKL